ncbi:MAG: alpha-amylase family glycosyl hydrolase [Bacteroidetes bacterium]|nr:alpha-amylase family glycosyl hydrolase [Bacteroidota bacterium]
MKRTLIFIAAILVTLSACKPKAEPKTQGGRLVHADWSRNATIYEVNVRQYTPEGTFKAFQQHLPRLQKMGVGILWLMPINPIGIKNRKGNLGSYYSVKDYLAVNPEFGTIADLKELVSKAHELGMYVIIDWVANHTSWDNALITQHPDWYKKDVKGNIIPPVADWTDAAALDYSKEGLRKYMTEALCFWVREVNIDGFRCDVAGMLPVSFWNHAMPEVRTIKTIFTLAEWETPEMHDTAFDATYSWELYKLGNDIAAGKKTADKIDSNYTAELKKFPADAYRMRFTTNHDENSWNGSEYERLGPAAMIFSVFSFTFPGFPLIYTGQESAMSKRLRFFNKDTVNWGTYPLQAFYTTLCSLKKTNKALQNGDSGGPLVKIRNDKEKEVYSFMREKDGNKVFVILNLSSKPCSVKFPDGIQADNWEPVFGKEKLTAGKDMPLKLKAWEYRVFQKR